MSIPTLASYPMPSQPPQNRVQWPLEASRAVLLIHDMQHYFLNKYDRHSEPIPTLIQHIQQLKARCAKLGIPVIYTAQPTEQAPEQRGLLTDFWGLGLSDPQYADQQAVIDELTPTENDLLQTKWRYSAFYGSDMRATMANWQRDQLIITGIYAHIGCLTTALEAFMDNIQSFFVLDALADFSLEDHLMASRYVAQRCGKVITTAQALQQL